MTLRRVLEGRDRADVLVPLTCLLLALAAAEVPLGHAQAPCSSTLMDDPMEPRGVKTLRLSCASGDVTWYQPIGALRLFLPRLDPDDIICFHFRFQSANVVATRGDHVLFTADESRKSLYTCLHVTSGPVELDASGQTTPSLAGSVALQYQVLPRGGAGRDMITDTGCPACADDQLLPAFCSSDVVIRGHVSAVDHTHTRGFQPITIATDDITRAPLFVRSKNGGKLVNMLLPADCKPRTGSGKLLVMGRHVVGRTFLSCVTTRAHWHHFLAVRGLTESDINCL